MSDTNYFIKPPIADRLEIIDKKIVDFAERKFSWENNIDPITKQKVDNPVIYLQYARSCCRLAIAEAALTCRGISTDLSGVYSDLESKFAGRIYTDPKTGEKITFQNVFEWSIRSISNYCGNPAEIDEFVVEDSPAEPSESTEEPLTGLETGESPVPT